MAIQLIDNFELSVTKPIDNRIVVGPGLTYTTKEGIPLPYAGMRIYDLNDNTAWVYKGTSWSADVEKISIQSGSQFATQSYLTFVSALSGINLVYSFANFRINPANGQLIGPTGTNANPTYGFTTSSATSFMGMWKSANDSLAFSIAGTKYFEIGTTGITASNSLRISNTSGSTNTVGGGSLILNAGTNKNFEFYSLSNDSLFRIYNSSSARILPGESTTATDRTLELQNETSRSIMKVRDYHRIRTHSGTGVISLGDGTNDDFVFYMNGWTLASPTNLTGTFSSSGGGLNIKNNLRVGRSTTLGGTVSISGNVGINATANTTYRLDVTGDTRLNGNVGISGPVTSGYKLYVTGGIVGVSGLIRVSNGTIANPAISFLDSTNTGLYYQVATDRLKLSTSAVNLLSLSTTDILTDIHNTITSPSDHGMGNSDSPSIASGVYDPNGGDNTIKNATNLNVSYSNQLYNAYWTRVGNVVSLSGQALVKSSSLNTPTGFDIYLPVASLFYYTDGSFEIDRTYLLSGVATINGVSTDPGQTYSSGRIYVETSDSNIAKLRFKSFTNFACAIYYNLQYCIIDASLIGGGGGGGGGGSGSL